jgi:S-adenosylhomocysteine hydrolase
MGINSTEVSYGFGQLGSVFTNLAKPVFPPKDHVIVAIQFLADNTPTSMITETLDTMGPQFPGTDDTEASANNYMGVHEAAAASVSGNVVTIADVANNVKIKPGQYVIIGADGDTIDAGMTLDTGAGHLTPIYQGPNAQGVVVKSLTGGTYGTTLTLGPPDNGTVAVDVSGIDSSNTLYFLDEYHGAGGSTMESIVFPKGVTIYGRWTTIVPSAAPVICYFGK